MPRRSELPQRAIALVGALVIIALVSGFTDRSSVASPRGWKRTDLQPVTQPVALAGRFLFYDARDGGMRVVAVDARTGRTLWTRPATRSEMTPGVAPHLQTVGSTVLALTSRFPGSPEGAISRLDARTGRVIWTTRSGWFRSMPVLCGDDDALVCADGPSSELRFDLTTGKPPTASPVRVSGRGSGTSSRVMTSEARSVGQGLVDPGSRSPEYLVGLRGTAVAWRKPVAPIFGKRASSDYGWSFRRYDGLGLFVGTENPAPLSATSTEDIVEFGDFVTAGLSIATGRVAWRDLGSKFECGWLTCPGEPLVGLRLHVRGTLTDSLKDNLTSLSPDFDTTLEAFSLATGKTTWRFDLGATTTLVWTTAAPPQTSADSAILPRASGGYAVLDLRTGARHPVARTTAAWCRKTIEYRQAEGWVSDGRTRYVYEGEGSLYPCDATGARVAPPARLPTYVAQIGATTDGIVAWSDSHLLIGMPTTG